MDKRNFLVKKTVFLLITGLIISQGLGVSTSQNVGIGDRASYSVNYASDQGVFESLDKYCRYWEIQSCAHKVKLSNPVATLKAGYFYWIIDIKQWYWENKLTGEPYIIKG